MPKKSKLIINKKEKSPKILSSEGYEAKIINYLRQYPSGLTITDISKGLGISRITINKYVLVLEAKGELFSKSIGAYNLYFTTERRFIPRETITAFYQGLLTGIASELSDKKEEIFKKVGLGMDKFITFPVGSKFPEEVLKANNGSYEKLFNYYAEVYERMDYILENTTDISLRINEKGNKAIYTFNNIKYLKDNKDFIMHFYIISGMIEKTLPMIIHKKVRSIVEKVYDNNVDLSIEIL